MDLKTAILWLMVIFIGLIPFVIAYYKMKKKGSKMLNHLKESAAQYGCSISQHEFCGNFIVGIDDKKHFVFFFKQKNEETFSKFVDLSDIQSCQVIKKSRNVKNDRGSFTVIERIDLAFSPLNKSKSDTRFELYEEEDNMQLSDELELAERWTKRINEKLKSI